MEYIFHILSTVLMIVAGFFFTYWKRSEKAQLISQEIVDKAVALAKELAVKASDLIAAAEDAYQGTGRGQEKFNFVVDAIMALIPDELEIFFPRSVIEVLVQSVFDGMVEFATSQIDKVLDKVMPKVSSEEIAE